MAFCINCGKDIGSGSAPCDACGKKRPNAVGPGLAGFIIGVTLSVVGGSLIGHASVSTSEPEVAQAEPATLAPATPSPTIPASPAPAEPEPAEPVLPPEPVVGSQWRYSADEDPMTSATTYFAVVRSTNQISLDFPYQRPQRATLMLRTHPRHGKDVIFSIERGQLLCRSYDGCSVLVRFDDAPAVRYRANGPSDNSSETLFLDNYGGFAENLLRARRVRIAAEIYRSGAPVFEFDVTGFDPKKYRPE